MATTLDEEDATRAGSDRADAPGRSHRARSHRARSHRPGRVRPDSEPAATAASGQGIGHRVAIALAFGSSAAVLVLELVSLRLVAPYLGLTLETNTAIIAVALAAIATGAAFGGRFADEVPPTRTLGPLLLASGALVLLICPRCAGPARPSAKAAATRCSSSRDRAVRAGVAAGGRDADGDQAPAGDPGRDRHGGGAAVRVRDGRRHRRHRADGFRLRGEGPDQHDRAQPRWPWSSAEWC
jgi:hypothetical protein